MARNAKKPMLIPREVELTIDGSLISAKGPKGQLTYTAHAEFDVTKDDEGLWVKPKAGEEGEFNHALWGTSWANIRNIVIGVSEGFSKTLLLVGVGYRAQLQGKALNLSLGYSHPVVFEIPEGISIEMPSQTEIIIKGIDKQLVGQVAADIRAKRPVEPYKGKGIRYKDEVVILKETKKK